MQLSLIQVSLNTESCSVIRPLIISCPLACLSPLSFKGENCDPADPFSNVLFQKFWTQISYFHYAQTVQDFEALGYAHVLPLAKDAETCKVVAMHLPSVGCAFSSFKLDISPDIAQGSLQKVEDIDMFHIK
jgi:hypothetical protein